LEQHQIAKLLDQLDKSKNKHVTIVAKICLSTGARWGEAETLRASQIRNGLIQFVHIKSSKARSVPIIDDLEKSIKEHVQDADNERLFNNAYAAFREGLNQAKLKLSKGQLTHILRHTFASHFMMNGGNILALQKVSGHQSLTMTMRYAQLPPEHLQQTRQLNPLARLAMSSQK
jgi:integrase